MRERQPDDEHPANPPANIKPHDHSGAGAPSARSAACSICSATKPPPAHAHAAIALETMKEGFDLRLQAAHWLKAPKQPSRSTARTRILAPQSGH
jgi:hypothetical protein